MMSVFLFIFCCKDSQLINYKIKYFFFCLLKFTFRILLKVGYYKLMLNNRHEISICKNVHHVTFKIELEKV